MYKNSIFPNIPPRLPLQDLIEEYRKNKKFSKAKLARRTHLSLYFLRNFLGKETCPIARGDLLKVCIALNLSFEEIENAMIIAGYLFAPEYPYYKYECQIIHRYIKGYDCLEEAIYRIQLLYGEVSEEE